MPYASTSVAKINNVKMIDRSHVPYKRRVPDTGRGSRQFVLIEAGASVRSFTVVCASQSAVLYVVGVAVIVSNAELSCIFAVCFSDLCMGQVTRGLGWIASIQGDFAHHLHLSLCITLQNIKFTVKKCRSSSVTLFS